MDILKKLQGERQLYSERAHNFICDEALQYKRKGYSPAETATIMDLPEIRVKKLIDEAENKLLTFRADYKKRIERGLEFDRERRRANGN